MNKKIGLLVFLLVSISVLAVAVGSASVYIEPKPAGTNDDLVCHVTGGCAGYHIIRWYRNNNFYSETLTNGAFSVDSSATADGDRWKCKAVDYCSGNPLGQDSVIIKITNYPPVISPNIPDLNLSENSGFNNNTLNLEDYVTDETPDNQLTYQIVGETDTSVVDCSIDINHFVDCDVQPDMVGYSDVRVRITDPEGLFAEDVFRVYVSPVNQLPIVNLVSPTPGQQFALCENITFYVNATDPDGTIQSIVWVINGTTYNGNNFTMPATTFSIGDVPVSVTAADNVGGTTTLNFNFSVLVHTNPTVTITQPVPNPVPTTIYPFQEGAMLTFNATAAATDPCTPPLGFQYIWRDNNVDILSDQQTFSLDNLTIGIHNITVYVTDGIGGEAFDSMIINITEIPNQCPVVQIINPTAGRTYANPCEQIDFNATAVDTDGTISSVAWIYSSGIISTSRNFAQTADYFGVGTHTVTFSAVDNEGCMSNVSVSFDVLEHINPVCNITSPINNPDPALYYLYPENSFIQFTATATAQDVCAPAQFSWIWRDNNVPIVTDTDSFGLDNLTTGEHNMTVYATDGYGGECYDTILINITEIPNIPPVANIITPVDNQPFVWECQLIGFTAQIFDPDVAGSINSITWMWNGNVLNLNGEENFTLNASRFNLGNNTVTLTVSDNEGAVTVDSVTFEVRAHSPPAVTVLSPPNGSAYPEGTFVNFDATAAPTDVCPAAYDWIWTDDSNPLFSIYQTFTLNNLSVGLHNITAYAYDQYGQSNYSRVYINITDVPNMPPVITSLVCVNETGGLPIREWDPIYCNATASDPDGVVTAYIWSLNGSGISIGPVPGTDVFEILAGLDDGNYTVNLMVLDNGTPVLSATDFRNIEVLENIPPVVTITSPAADPYRNMEFCAIDFSATASDSDGYILQPWDEIYTWNVMMANGTSAFITDDQSFTYAKRLPVGFSTFSVTVTDDDGATATDTVAINTTKNVPPTVEIQLPVPFDTYNISEGNNITFDAWVTAGAAGDDCLDCTVLDNYTWAWFDRYNDGVNPPVTTQISDQETFTFVNPAVGIHTITVTGTDCYGASNIDTIIVNVTEVPNQIPVVTITFPVDPSVDYYIDHCEDVFFNATAVDPDGDDIESWFWSYITKDGQQATPLQSFTVPALNFTIGNHTVYAYAYDNQTPPGVGSDSQVFEVIEHTDPVAAIAEPINGTNYLVGLPINFSGFANATDRCNADQFSYVWTEDGNPMSTSQEFMYAFNTSQLGWHKINLIATDQHGHPDIASVWINITENVNVAPVINGIWCYDMLGNATIMEFEQFFCNATATDIDGNITAWVWNVDSFPTQTGSNTFVSPSGLPNGTYNATLTVVDNGTTTPPLSATLAIPVDIINNRPAVTIVPPSQSGNEPFNANFTCSVAGGDMPYTYSVNYSNGFTAMLPAGNLTSVVFNTTYTQNGTYNVTCYVADMDGDSDAASALVTVGDTGPVALFNWTPLTPYENETVTFMDLSTWTSDPIVSWFWDFGDGTNLTSMVSVNPTHRYLSDGIYTVTLTVTDSDGSVASLPLSITVLDTVPTAAMTVTPNPSVEGVNITFVGFGTAYDMPINYTWDFGDGNTATGQVVGHVYDATGAQTNYTATLTVTDFDGSTTSVSEIVQINDTAPTANAGLNQTVYECSPVQFNGSLSTGYDIPLAYSWDFGDGIGTSTMPEPIYNYQQNGTYTVTLTVTDFDGTSDIDTIVVTVMDTRPNAFFNYTPYNPDEGITVNFDSTGSVLNLCDGNANPANYNFSWDFGDGNSTSGMGMDTASLPYADQGNYTVNLTITDNDMSADSYTLTVIVADVNPAAAFTYAPLSPNEADTVTFDPSSTAAGSPYDAITSYVWDFGDGSAATTTLPVTQGHVYADNGTYNATLTVNDEDSFDVFSQLVTVANVAPQNVEAYGIYNCQANTSTLVIATATDPAGIEDPLIFQWDFNYSTSVFDVNASSGPTTNGTYVVDMPCPGIVGMYNLGLRVMDDDGGIGYDNATLNVSIVKTNTPPYFTPALLSQPWPTSTLFEYDVNATDPDGDSFNFSSTVPIDSATGLISFITPALETNITINVTVCDNSTFANACNSGLFTLYVTAANIPPTASFTYAPTPPYEGGVVSFTSTSTDTDGSIVSWSWLFGDGNTGSGPAPTNVYADNGVYTVNLTVVDNEGAIASTITDITVDNVPPTPNAGGPYSGNEGTLIALNGASATDPAGINDPLTYAWDLTQPNDGVYETPGQVVSFNAVDDGAYTVGLQVNDDDGGISATTATVNVNNVAPTAEAGGPYSCTVGGSAALSGSATDPGVSDTFTYEWDLDNNFVYETPGQNVLFNCVAVGTFTVNLRVTDDDGGIGTDFALVTVSAVPDVTPPVVTLQLPADDSTDIDGNVMVQYLVVDDMAATLSCDAYSNVSGTWQVDVSQVTANNTPNTFSYLGLGDASYEWNVQCSDGTNTASAPADFTFIVNTAIPNTPPTIAGLPDQSYVEGSGLHNNVMDLWAYASDAEDADNLLTFTITLQTNAPLVNCVVDANQYIDCTTVAGTGSSDVTVSVMDTGGLSAQDTFTVTVTSLPPVNQPPIANAGPDQSVLVNTPVALDGTASSDPDNQPVTPLTYSWTQISGTGVVLTGSNTANPTFTSPGTASTLVFNLTVYDGQDYASDTVTINVFDVSDAITTSGFGFYDMGGNPIITIAPSGTFNVLLTINNMQDTTLNNIASTITAAGFIIVTNSDGNNNPTIIRNIGPMGDVTIGWQLTAPAASASYPISVNTAGIVDSGNIQVS